MQTNFSARMRNVLLGIILIGVVLFPGPVVGNRVSGTDIQEVTSSQPDIDNTVSTLTDSGGTLILPGGDKVEQQAVYLPKSRSTRARIPGPVYELGCSAVSGEIISGGLDRGGKYSENASQASPSMESLTASGAVVWVNMNSYPNLYTGPTNGGVMPEDNSPWPTWTDRCGDTYPNNPLLASHMGVDGRTTRGTIDDYWDCYESKAKDPYITGGWLPHIWGDAIGDFMYTSQSEFDNDDGLTKFYNNPVHHAGQ